VRNYLSYLDTVFLTVRVPVWSTNLSAKAAKTPKTFVSDSGLAAHLMQVEPEALLRAGNPAPGPLVETLVVRS
jgi:predicted AAA+ superfamily ATPase